jgi:hypothetical protein
MRFGHAQNLGGDRSKFLWRLRHNTGNFAEFGPQTRLLRLVNAEIQSLADKFRAQGNRDFSVV